MKTAELLAIEDHEVATSENNGILVILVLQMRIIRRLHGDYIMFVWRFCTGCMESRGRGDVVTPNQQRKDPGTIM